MVQFLAGMLMFFGMHSMSALTLPTRDRLAAKSEAGWKLTYAIVSIIGIFLMARGYADLRMTPTVLYVTPLWMRHVAAVLLLPTFVFLLASVIPGRIQRTLKHPLLIATKTWALAHLLVNGNLADVLLFGSFLAWAVGVRISLKKRPKRENPMAPESRANDVIVLVVGLGLYVVTALWLHEMLFGVRPFG